MALHLHTEHSRLHFMCMDLQVSVKRGTAYNRCLAGQSSTANVPCEAGVVAEDSIDGDSIQNRVSLRTGYGLGESTTDGLSMQCFITIAGLIFIPDSSLFCLL